MNERLNGLLYVAELTAENERLKGEAAASASAAAAAASSAGAAGASEDAAVEKLKAEAAAAAAAAAEAAREAEGALRAQLAASEEAAAAAARDASRLREELAATKEAEKWSAQTHPQRFKSMAIRLNSRLDSSIAASIVYRVHYDQTVKNARASEWATELNCVPGTL